MGAVVQGVLLGGVGSGAQVAFWLAAVQQYPRAAPVSVSVRARHVRYHDAFAASRCAEPAPHTGSGTTTRATASRAGRACGSRASSSGIR